MKSVLKIVIGLVLLTILTVGRNHLISAQEASFQTQESSVSSMGFDAVDRHDPERMAKKGQEIFRFDTFGDEAFWVTR